MTKKELLEAINTLFEDEHLKANIENCKHFDACYNVRTKTLEIQLYDDKRRLT